MFYGVLCVLFVLLIRIYLQYELLKKKIKNIYMCILIINKKNEEMLIGNCFEETFLAAAGAFHVKLSGQFILVSWFGNSS